MSGYLTAVGDAVYVTFEVTVDATVRPCMPVFSREGS